MKNKYKMPHSGLYLIAIAFMAVYFGNKRFDWGFPDFLQGAILGCAIVLMLVYINKMGKIIRAKKNA
ncbi:hypothetical protein EJP82_00585 [Paenibacillus anaericanus]|uniref:Uncharacterized protein n=1 Tax=Paenibacillus anaericanus TaxID=170367 RepID=A0A3S1DZD1_9BACL|nr:hypothetical protein [Paenibacillus anaericanus]RUT48479.1 hypothetical protein EJP82_00585 [Paenibacillus anaericanus]